MRSGSDGRGTCQVPARIIPGRHTGRRRRDRRAARDMKHQGRIRVCSMQPRHAIPRRPPQGFVSRIRAASSTPPAYHPMHSGELPCSSDHHGILPEKPHSGSAHARLHPRTWLTYSRIPYPCSFGREQPGTPLQKNGFAKGGSPEFCRRQSPSIIYGRIPPVWRIPCGRSQTVQAVSWYSREAAGSMAPPRTSSSSGCSRQTPRP